ncbi:MAG: hypothetical protein ABIM88_05060 [candidate division WOR-3 bacterium]
MRSLRARIPYAMATKRDDEPGHLQADTYEHSGGFRDPHREKGNRVHNLKAV